MSETAWQVGDIGRQVELDRDGCLQLGRKESTQTLGRPLSVAQRAWPQDGDVALVLGGSVGLLIESSPGYLLVFGPLLIYFDDRALSALWGSMIDRMR